MKTIFKRPPIISYKRDKSLNWRHACKSKNWCKLRQLILRHNHKTTLGACASLSLTSSVLNWKNQNSTSVTKDLKNRFIFYCQKKKTKTRCYKTEKPETADGQQLDRKRSKNRSFYCKTRKTDLKDGQNRKSQRAPLQIQILGHACW